MFGVMQGRLLPQYQGRYQAHPVGYWQQEFKVAKSLGLDAIEFILDFNDVLLNPLMSDQGVAEIKEWVGKTNVSVKTICVDYLMQAPLHSVNQATAARSREVLLNILQKTRPLGITDMVIPCVDQSSLNGPSKADRFIEVILSVVDDFEAAGVNLSLETDLAPKPFVRLLERIGSSRVTVNYDIGNSAALGYDPGEELDCYGHCISDIHIKDRVLGGGPVVLGTGNADFRKFFDKLSAFDYRGPFIMQAYRDGEGVAIFKQQMEWIKPYLYC